MPRLPYFIAPKNHPRLVNIPERSTFFRSQPLHSFMTDTFRSDTKLEVHDSTCLGHKPVGFGQRTGISLPAAAFPHFGFQRNLRALRAMVFLGLISLLDCNRVFIDHVVHLFSGSFVCPVNKKQDAFCNLSQTHLKNSKKNRDTCLTFWSIVKQGRRSIFANEARAANAVVHLTIAR